MHFNCKKNKINSVDGFEKDGSNIVAKNSKIKSPQAIHLYELVSWIEKLDFCVIIITLLKLIICLVQICY